LFNPSILSCYSLKKRLEEALEDAFPNAGAIRLETRTIYVARVIDAINTALSKHDQVVIPASTRLGRVRAAVPACMACDRPLTTKGRKRAPDNNIVSKPGFGTSGEDSVQVYGEN
jgi:hypothetical protein